MRSAAVSLPDAPDDHPRHVLLAELRVGGRPLVVANTHLAWRPELLTERDAQAASLLAAIAEFSGKAGICRAGRLAQPAH
mgnify:CR=1 FL=1